MNFKKVITYTIIVFISIFFGYQVSQNKRIIIGFYNKISKITERYYYFTLNKIGLSELEKKIDINKITTHEDNIYTEFPGNSYSYSMISLQLFE